MSIKNGGPAFPHDGQADYTGGLTLRDYFAAKAMQGIMANHRMLGEVAKAAYEIADVMLAERENGGD
jgi:hypothetical protein